MNIPIATYRFQFREGMDFDKAVGIVPYLRDLGISHLYASPIFAAPAGSTHGYDVADHNEIDPALGGRAGFERLVEALRAAGMGLVLDIVPNHMAASLENRWWRSVSQWGEQSSYARHFDIDWSRRLTLPILGRPFEEALAEGELRLDLDAEAGTLALCYFDNALPLHTASWDDVFSMMRHPLAQRLAELVHDAKPEQAEALYTSVRNLAASHEVGGLREELATLSADHDFLDTIHRRQPWELIFWKEARRNLSYRRFFEVTGLVGVRVEDEQVFDDVHRLTLELVRSGQVQGLRIDHVDGLADPADYLRRLRERIGPDVYLVVEKILGDGDELRRDWPVQGATGYEFIDALADVLADPEGVAALSRAYQAATDSPSIHEQRRSAKQQVLRVNFEGEVSNLAGLLSQCVNPSSLEAETLRDALIELIVAMPVYRIYGEGDEDRAVMDRALEQAMQAAPALADMFRLIHAVLLGDHPAAKAPQGRLARERFQQLTGPAMAKGVEDTLFYRDNRFIAFNEVGCDPGRPSPSLDSFHRAMAARAATAPHALSATATHDTKRGEDARARLMALSEIPEEWSVLVERWRERYFGEVTALPGGPAPEPELEWLIFQALAGCWPADRAQSSEAFRDRFLAYLEKVLREAKLRTSWTDIDEHYEVAVKRYAAAVLADHAFAEDMERAMRRLGTAGWLNSLTQTMLKLTAPGVPDIFQGSEAGDFSLVDPDNRRPADFERLSSTLRHGPRSSRDYPALKQRLIARLLAARRGNPALFAEGGYLPLEAVGPRRDHVVAFARVHRDQALIVLAPRLTLGLLDADGAILTETWKGTSITPPTEWNAGSAQELISGRQVDLQPQIEAAEMLAGGFPAALLCTR